MTNLGLAVVLQALMFSGGTDTYAEAHRETTETGRPMVVMVSAEWCPACQTMKKNVIPEVKRRGVLGKVAFAIVNLDRERKLGRELIRGGPIPQLLMFRKADDGWKLRRLVGGKSANTVENFIEEGIKLDEAERHADKAETKSPQKRDSTAAVTRPAERTAAKTS